MPYDLEILTYRPFKETILLWAQLNLSLILQKKFCNIKAPEKLKKLFLI